MSVSFDQSRPDLGGNVRFGDLHSWTPLLWKYLRDVFAIRSMLDVGCGEGHTVAFFHRLGVHAHGIDGLRVNIDRAVISIAQHDILREPYTMPVDLTWSCEVAEHIDPAKVDHFLDTLANGKVVAMTHALPEQPGHHHVNCQPQEYWITKMQSRGYSLSLDNDIFRAIASKSETWTYFGRTGLIFLRY
jgi:hypothetical protein